MRSAGPKFLSLLLLGGLLFLAPRAWAADDAPWTDRFFSEFSEIKTRIAALEQQQKEILAKEDIILEKLDQLRIWVHRK